MLAGASVTQFYPEGERGPGRQKSPRSRLLSAGAPGAPVKVPVGGAKTKRTISLNRSQDTGSLLRCKSL